MTKKKKKKGTFYATSDVFMQLGSRTIQPGEKIELAKEEYDSLINSHFHKKGTLILGQE